MSLAMASRTSAISRNSFWSADGRHGGAWPGRSTLRTIFIRSGKIAPRQRRGRNGLIGVRANSFCCPEAGSGRWRKGYRAVDPAGVATSTPSHTSSAIRTRSPTVTFDLGGLAGFAQQRKFVDCAKGVAFAVLRNSLHAERRISTSAAPVPRARQSRCAGHSGSSRNPTVPRFMP